MAQAIEPSHWEVLSERHVANCKVFDVYEEHCRHPVDGREGDFYSIASRDWVNILALTPDRELVMVRQYRFAIRALSWEIPGGIIDPGESPLDAGLRELREETGHEGENARIIGSLFANPAIMNNQVHTVLVDNCVQKHELEWDEGEDILVRPVPIADIPGLIGTGKICHSIIVAALQLFALERGN